MNFRTSFSPKIVDFQLEFNQSIVTIGSCFSEVIGRFLTESKFSTLSNPFGTVYNISSISELITGVIASEIKLNRGFFFERDGVVFHHLYHSSFYGKNKADLEKEILAASYTTKQILLSADLLIITLGTSWVYELQGETVSNCHKRPQTDFTKRILELDEQTEILETLIRKLKTKNPKLKILLTVSPVRHIKDGIPENSYSKSLLKVLCEKTVNSLDGVYYFPSYEIMMDDLRDYRFYKEDLIHPNEMAEKYIIEAFCNAAFSPRTNDLLKKWKKVKIALSHRPFNPGSEPYRKFLGDLQQKINGFSEFFDVGDELNQVKVLLERT